MSSQNIRDTQQKIGWVQICETQNESGWWWGKKWHNLLLFIIFYCMCPMDLGAKTTRWGMSVKKKWNRRLQKRFRAPSLPRTPGWAVEDARCPESCLLRKFNQKLEYQLHDWSKKLLNLLLKVDYFSCNCSSLHQGCKNAISNFRFLVGFF